MAALLDSRVDFRTGLKDQIGIAGEHRASKVRTGAFGRGAALPASVRRMLEARWRDTVFRRTGLASYGDLRAVAAREAATPSATRNRVDASEITLYFVPEEGCAPTYLDDDDAQLSYFGVPDGATVDVADKVAFEES